LLIIIIVIVIISSRSITLAIVEGTREEAEAVDDE